MKDPEGKSRMELVREGKTSDVSMEGRRVVDIGKLVEDEKNERKTYNQEALNQLADTIRQHGVIIPPTAKEVDGGFFQILTGHRRVRASKIAGLKKIEIIVRVGEDDSKTRIKSLVSNIHSENINPIEVAFALQSIIDNEANDIKTQQDLAKALGKNKGWVSHILKILTLPPTLQEKVASTQLILSYEAVASVARIEDSDLQSELIDGLIQGTVSRADVREKVREQKGGEGKKRDDENLTPKPRYVFSTKQSASVIIQSKEPEGLTKEQKVKALQEALRAAKKQEEE